MSHVQSDRVTGGVRRSAGVVTSVLWPGLVDGEAGHRGVGWRHPQRLSALFPRQVGGDTHPRGEVDHAVIVVPEEISQLISDHSEVRSQLTRTQTPGRQHCLGAHRRSELSPSG